MEDRAQNKQPNQNRVVDYIKHRPACRQGKRLPGVELGEDIPRPSPLTLIAKEPVSTVPLMLPDRC